MNELTAFLKKMFPAINSENENKLIEEGLIDSLDLFRLVAALEEDYKISIPFDEILFENFNAISDIHSLITKLSK